MPLMMVGFDRKAWKINNPTYGTDFTGGATYAADNYPNATFSPDKAFDDLTNTYWRTSTGVNYPHWVQVDLGAGVTKIARKLRILKYAFAEYLCDFKLQGSNDGSIFTDIYTGISAYATGWQEYTFSNSTGYRYYRIYGTSGYSVEIMGIYEVELMEVVA